MVALTESASRNFATCVVMMVLVFFFVGLRLYSVFFRLKQPLKGPDWLCLFAVSIFYTHCAIIIDYIYNVSSIHTFDLDLTLNIDELVALMKRGFPLEVLFGFQVTAVKLSILWFYHLIFSPKAERVIQAAVALCMLWFIVATFIVIFQCKPVSAYWNQLAQPPYCMGTPQVLLGYELSNLIIDVIILCIPIRYVSFLKMSVSKKLSVLAMFLLGALVIIASILRLLAVWHPPDVVANFDFPSTIVWSTVQSGLAIICCCLPTYRPILVIVYKFFRLPGMSSAKTQPTKDNIGQYGTASKSGTWVRVGENQDRAYSHAWPHGTGGSSDVELVPPRGIRVDREINVV